MAPGHELLDALGAAVYTTDAEGRITYYNAAAARLWGREPRLGELWCGSWRLYQPDGQPLPHDQCPMALALKERRPIRGVEAVLERPDGSRVLFMPLPTPLFDADGNLTGAVNLLVDLTRSHEAEAHRARLAAIVASSDDAIVSKTLQGYITSWNAGAERIFGYPEREMIGQHITKIIPPELHDEETDILARLSRGERIDHYETVRVAKDGRQVNISLTVSPLRDMKGDIIGASKVGRDITERKRAEQVQRLLVNELNHRVKNTLATVDAIAKQTLRRSANPADFVASFSGRLRALSRAHSLLTNTTFLGAPISQLIQDQLIFGDASDSRISWSGPDVTLDAQSALHMALVLHELGTNARKHGALSNASGSVRIEWIVESRQAKTLVLDWRESGGPQVSVNRPTGFGTTLIEQSLKPHGGDVVITFSEHGMSCRIVLPLVDQTEAMAALAASGRRLPTAAEPLPNSARGLSGKRILVVEDEALIAMVLDDYLADAGCEVIGPAATVEAGMALANANELDAALLDANLAGRRVDDLAQLLVKKGVPFAFVTGYGRDGLSPSFDDAPTVEKPFSQVQILDALNQMLSRSEAGVVDLKEQRRKKPR